MKNSKLGKNNGITLIALVITIIVLLILAGVAIAMLSGENGILKKAAEAKTKTESAQKQEEAILTDMELTTNFLTKNSNYKCSNGYITGITVGDTVAKLERALPYGYKVTLEYDFDTSTKTGEDKAIEESQKESTKIATGMAVTKNGQEVARTVLFGDFLCNGKINAIDRGNLHKYMSDYDILELKEFQRLAGNVHDDDELNKKDLNALTSYINHGGDIDQNRSIKTLPKDIKRWNTKIQGYINSLDKDTGYEFEYNEKHDVYKIKGISKDKKAGELISELPNSNELKILDENRAEVAENNVVSTGYYIKWTFKTEDDVDYSILFATIETK